MAMIARREPEPEMGPAMRALPSNRWRTFVSHYLMLPPSRVGVFSNQAEAARRAGPSSPQSCSRRATATIL